MSTPPRSDYWSRFWLEHTADLTGQDEQAQVLRTLNKKTIAPDTWAYTLATVMGQLNPSPADQVLDLGCGNGLFTAALSPLVQRVDALDLSPQLIARVAARRLPNVRVHAEDVRDAVFESAAFSKVLWYAGIQYLDEHDIVIMIRRIRQWMQPGGTLLIGDVLDRSKLWSFFDDSTRQQAYFDGIARRQPVIGTWLDASWLEACCQSAGFREAKATPQDPALIYAHFRFDLIGRA